ncbi:DNA-binding transcriptional LysR family regulator [Rhodoblastus acidophilus]|uniref:LysR substrate-binding domain-containing protein n=1 Tax=Rhodoblastus acidophilus TaxID=1074 RepID=UPI0022258F04|nr:LysR substrate-binding domain-containing protein [Rhodoblastus acidophilus]MCW2284803.1 DNA-binding transcriptional LysR family regulator [Rhodoblastus acidophilus]MCW2333756.1 DNA-binding transcriptional LysR family regulator [Rhodoblastus acidophilus]
MDRRLPLTALRIFEVAARTGSYAEAGAELGLTHGAVSRQIATLESWLGQRLFVRTGRRMTATPAARAFAAEVSLSFDRIAAAAEACGRPAARQILRVSAPTTFALRWLIPRLEKFHAAHPQVEAAVTTTTTLHEELRGGFDVAIRRRAVGSNFWPQHHATFFLRETDTLMVSPALLARAPLSRPSDIADHVLLASETRPGDWSNWMERAGVPHRSEQRRRVFDHFFVTLQAVVDGLGLAIGPVPVLEIDLAAGRLVAPFPEIQVPRPGYVALVPFDASKTPALTHFVDWLVQEGGLCRQE